MRLLTYNIAYGTGCPENLGKSILTAHRYLKTPRRDFKRICRFIDAHNPDIVALVEVDTGSFRNDYVNQAERIAEVLDSYQCSGIKYSENSIGRKLPILRRQANAILTKKIQPEVKFHYFPIGFKRLVIELVLEHCNLFLVHLALQAKARKQQLEELKQFIPEKRPVIITGDFNTLLGNRELDHFCTELNLYNANTSNIPTFPSWAPQKQLDFILCSKEIKAKNFLVPKIKFSDHLPLIFDFTLSDQPSSRSDPAN